MSSTDLAPAHTTATCGMITRRRSCASEWRGRGSWESSTDLAPAHTTANWSAAKGGSELLGLVWRGAMPAMCCNLLQGLLCGGSSWCWQAALSPWLVRTLAGQTHRQQ